MVESPSSQQVVPLAHDFVAVQLLSVFTQTDVVPATTQLYPLGHSFLSEHSVFPLVNFGEQAARRSRTNARFDFIASTNPLPTSLASSTLQIGGLLAPLLSASPSQIDLQVPWELAGQPQAMVTATVGSVISNRQTMSIAPFSPGIFSLNKAGLSQGMVMIAGSQTLAAPLSGRDRRPAVRGELISIYCTGLGAVTNQPATGFAAQASPLSVTTTTPTVTIGGVEALVISSGLAPGAVGVYQVNVQVPMRAAVGNAVLVVLHIGGVTSNAVTIAAR